MSAPKRRLKLFKHPMGDLVEFTDEEMALVPRVHMVPATPTCAICDETGHAAPNCPEREVSA